MNRKISISNGGIFGIEVDLPFFYKRDNIFFGLLPLESGKIRTISIFERSITWDDRDIIKEFIAKDIQQFVLMNQRFSKISERDFIAKLLLTPIKNADL